MNLLVILTAMCTVFCLITSLLYWFNRDRYIGRRRIEGLFDEGEKQSRALRRRKKENGETAGRRGRLEKLSDELYVAGVALRAQEFITIWVAVAIVLPVLLLFLGVPSMMCIGTCIVGATAPIAYIKIKRHNRLALFDKQLLDALAVMCNSLRAGLSFQTAMQCISQEMEEPISKEFGRVYRECQMGMPLETSFNRLIQRTENSDLELICSAVLIQKQIGGNLAAVLENISGTIGERIQMRREIKTLTSSGVMSGYIVGALPVFLLVMMMFLNPSYIDMFFTTRAGNLMLAVSVVMELIGFSMVKKIVNIKM